MEKEPNKEKYITKIDVFNILKEKGNGPEFIAAVTEWTIQTEKLVKSSKDAIVLNIERVDFYVAIGDIDQSLLTLDEALLQAEQENQEDLKIGILKKIEKVKKLI